jgi:K+-transporting ATPase ATPase A chain
MNLPNLSQYAIFLVIVIACVKPVGTYLFRVFNGHKTLFDRALLPIERFIYRAAGIDPQFEMDWKQYTPRLSFLAYSGRFFSSFSC